MDENKKESKKLDFSWLGIPLAIAIAPISMIVIVILFGSIFFFQSWIIHFIQKWGIILPIGIVFIVLAVVGNIMNLFEKRKKQKSD